MKKNEFNQLKSQDVKELLRKAETIRQELKKLKVEQSSNRLKNMNLSGQKKKDLARVLTMIKGKELVK